MRVHPLRRLAAAGAGESDRPAMRKARQQGHVRLAHEQHGRHATKLKRLHDVGRAGQVVAIIAEKQVLHGFQAALPSPNLSIDRASSGWLKAKSASGMPSTAACQACCTRSEEHTS